jgi:hypothetical protein
MATNRTSQATPMPGPSAAEPEPVPTRVPGRSRLAVVGVTAVAALAGWAIVGPLAGITLEARQGGLMHIGAAAVFFSSVVVAFAGWGLLAILERCTVKAQNVWTSVAAIVCVTSLSSPLGNGIGLGAKLGLASLHLIVGAVVIIGLRRTALSACERCV